MASHLLTVRSRSGERCPQPSGAGPFEHQDGPRHARPRRHAPVADTDRPRRTAAAPWPKGGTCLITGGAADRPAPCRPRPARRATTALRGRPTGDQATDRRCRASGQGDHEDQDRGPGQRHRCAPPRSDRSAAQRAATSASPSPPDRGGSAAGSGAAVGETAFLQGASGPCSGDRRTSDRVWAAGPLPRLMCGFSPGPRGPDRTRVRRLEHVPSGGGYAGIQTVRFGAPPACPNRSRDPLPGRTSAYVPSAVVQ